MKEAIQYFLFEADFNDVSSMAKKLKIPVRGNISNDKVVQTRKLINLQVLKSNNINKFFSVFRSTYPDLFEEINGKGIDDLKNCSKMLIEKYGLHPYLLGLALLAGTIGSESSIDLLNHYKEIKNEEIKNEVVIDSGVSGLEKELIAQNNKLAEYEKQISELSKRLYKKNSEVAELNKRNIQDKVKIQNECKKLTNIANDYNNKYQSIKTEFEAIQRKLIESEKYINNLEKTREEKEKELLQLKSELLASQNNVNHLQKQIKIWEQKLPDNKPVADAYKVLILGDKTIEEFDIINEVSVLMHYVNICDLKEISMKDIVNKFDLALINPMQCNNTKLWNHIQTTSGKYAKEWMQYYSSTQIKPKIIEALNKTTRERI